MNATRALVGACAAAVLLWPAATPAQQVFKEITPKRLEGILDGMSLQYKKLEGAPGVTYYDFKMRNLTVRLTNFNGKDLLIDMFMTPIDLKRVNEWNRKAKFTRAYLATENGVESVVLASNLDILGGVTDDTVKQFLREFETSLTDFSNFTAPAVIQEEVYKGIPVARLEKVLDAMGVKYKKASDKGKHVYGFTRKVGDKEYAVRLTNFNGEDLMIDARFPAAPLAKVNVWNARRNYVRAGLYPAKDGAAAYAALEANLDCVAGTSDGMVRYFITSFDQEMVLFEKHLQGK
jgi:hypothetical protein